MITAAEYEAYREQLLKGGKVVRVAGRSAHTVADLDFIMEAVEREAKVEASAELPSYREAQEALQSLSRSSVVEQEKAALVMERHELREQVDALQVQVDELQRDKSAMEFSLKSLADEKAKVEATNTALSTENGDLRAQVDWAQAKIADLTKELAAWINGAQSFAVTAPSDKGQEPGEPNTAVKPDETISQPDAHGESASAEKPKQPARAKGTKKAPSAPATETPQTGE